MFPIFQIGPIALQAPGLILLVGLWLGLVLAERLAPRFNTHPSNIYNIVFVGLISGVLGARLSFIFQNLDVFFQNPFNIFSLNPGLLDPIGGAGLAIITVLIYGYRKQLSWWPTLDATTPFWGVMWITIGISNLASGNAFGVETTLPWGINLWGALRHPTQVYQILSGCIILGLIWPRTVNSKVVHRSPGVTFLFFLILSSGSWLLIEGFRGDSVVLPNGIRVVQIAAWLILAVSMLGIRRLNCRYLS